MGNSSVRWNAMKKKGFFISLFFTSLCLTDNSPRSAVLASILLFMCDYYKGKLIFSKKYIYYYDFHFEDLAPPFGFDKRKERCLYYHSV